jgi:manganese/zinc/iron transport system ATP- binding protein
MALWDVSFQIPTGLLVSVMGPNGAGKSTLLKAALGLIRPLSGRIAVLGGAIDQCRSKVAYVPQRESVDWDFPITVEEVVWMGRYGQMGLFQRLTKADREAAAIALEEVGLASLSKRQIGELSGGQKQRLFLARALVQRAELFVLDEPFAGVDVASEAQIMEILVRLKRQGKTILVVNHDLSRVSKSFDWCLLLNTRLISCGPVAESFTEPHLTAAFGKCPSIFFEAATTFATTQSGQ